MTVCIITQSSVKTWRRCRRQYAYKYVEKLRPKSVSRPLAFGSLLHRMIELRAVGKNWKDALKEMNQKRSQVFAAELDLWDQVMLDGEMIMAAYAQFYHDDPITPVAVKGKRAEHKFQLDLVRGKIVLQGKIDMIGETDDGRRWLVEHKTRGGRIEDEGTRVRDLQTMVYERAAVGVLGIKKISGVLWDYIRSKSPQRPELLKDGTLSKRKIDTLPAVYEAAIKEHGLHPRNYTDVLGVLDENLSNWFRRVQLPTNRHAIDEMMEDMLVTGMEIKRKAGVDITRNITRDCSWCSYERLCTAELFNMDASHIREREYRVDEHEHQELAEESE